MEETKKLLWAGGEPFYTDPYMLRIRKILHRETDHHEGASFAFDALQSMQYPLIIVEARMAPADIKRYPNPEYHQVSLDFISDVRSLDAYRETPIITLGIGINAVPSQQYLDAGATVFHSRAFTSEEKTSLTDVIKQYLRD